MNSPQEDGDRKKVLVTPQPQEDSAVRTHLEIYSDDGNIRTLHDIEMAIITFALSHYGGRMSEVARRLHISRSTLYRKIEESQN